MKNFDISKQQFEETPLTLACHHYTSFLTATAWSESYPVVLAALLPCFWIYAEVGKDHVYCFDHYCNFSGDGGLVIF
jgi:thiaminase (transcriptional activator TenA)